MHKARADIEQALEIKEFEKVFQNDLGVLKALNIHNAEEAYLDLASYIETALKVKHEQVRGDIKGNRCVTKSCYKQLPALFTRIREIEFVESAMKKEKKFFVEDDDTADTVEVDENKEDMMEWELTKR